MGWGILRVLVAIVLVWIVVLVLMLAAPAAEFRAAIGIDPQAWFAGGAVLGLLLGYAALIRRARAAAVRRWGQADSPGLAALSDKAARVDTATSDARRTGWGEAQSEALDRYARHIVLREIGGPGQARLRDSSVLIVGAGGLGAPAALYLAAAGVGRITIADPDEVSVSNLQRQIIYRSSDAGRPKGLAAAEALRALNPLVHIQAMRRALDKNDEALIGEFDLVLDGTDRFATRAEIGTICAKAGVPLISGAISQWEGQLTLYDPSAGGPCFACIFPEAPSEGLALSCAEAGVAGPLPGVIGSMMALEAIKQITGAGASLLGRMLIFDGLYGENRTITLHRRKDCPVCSGVEQNDAEA
ncbi:molybdopterin-synthase adenylyltransferase MoeB [Paracoccus aurantiacus]|uniref:Molybdopterin-synthase adenylyltransferase n=2 Tax=Paracoccus aurantiacus TaxID=2599412 RepID=A0A5C6S2V1_9RHOB|nr:molybdopterin-synthase adenylyltransferase MoeB [Paracoccus aurantiacus]